MSEPFKVGDRVVCVDDGGLRAISHDEQYIVTAAEVDALGIQRLGLSGDADPGQPGWLAHRFRLIQSAPRGVTVNSDGTAQEVPAGDARFLELLDELRDLHSKKAADYGRGHDPLANLRRGSEVGIDNWRGVWLRAKDKVQRMDSFCLNGRLENEGVADTLKDLAAYALLTLRIYEEKDPTTPSS